MLEAKLHNSVADVNHPKVTVSFASNGMVASREISMVVVELNGDGSIGELASPYSP